MLIGVRCQPDFLDKVDKWRGEEPNIPSRPQAIRQLAEIGLQASKGSRRLRSQ
jgi:hypothetical protein